MTIADMSPQCGFDSITLSVNITHCIRREMFFSCKDEQMTSNEKCKSLLEFGRGWWGKYFQRNSKNLNYFFSLYWPWQCYHRKRNSGSYKNKINDEEKNSWKYFKKIKKTVRNTLGIIKKSLNLSWKINKNSLKKNLTRTTMNRCEMSETRWLSTIKI